MILNILSSLLGSLNYWKRKGSYNLLAWKFCTNFFALDISYSKGKFFSAWAWENVSKKTTGAKYERAFSSGHFIVCYFAYTCKYHCMIFVAQLTWLVSLSFCFIWSITGMISLLRIFFGTQDSADISNKPIGKIDLLKTH